MPTLENEMLNFDQLKDDLFGRSYEHGYKLHKLSQGQIDELFAKLRRYVTSPEKALVVLLFLNQEFFKQPTLFIIINEHRNDHLRDCLFKQVLDLTAHLLEAGISSDAVFINLKFQLNSIGEHFLGLAKLNSLFHLLSILVTKGIPANMAMAFLKRTIRIADHENKISFEAFIDCCFSSIEEGQRVNAIFNNAFLFRHTWSHPKLVDLINNLHNADSKKELINRLALKPELSKLMLNQFSSDLNQDTCVLLLNSSLSNSQLISLVSKLDLDKLKHVFSHNLISSSHYSDNNYALVRHLLSVGIDGKEWIYKIPIPFNPPVFDYGRPDERKLNQDTQNYFNFLKELVETRCLSLNEVDTYLHVNLITNFMTNLCYQDYCIYDDEYRHIVEFWPDTEIKFRSGLYFDFLCYLKNKGLDLEKIQSLFANLDLTRKIAGQAVAPFIAEGFLDKKALINCLDLKSDVLTWIQEQPEEKRLVLLVAAHNPHSGLGQYFYLARGRFPVSHHRGVMAEVDAALNQLPLQMLDKLVTGKLTDAQIRAVSPHIHLDSFARYLSQLHEAERFSLLLTAYDHTTPIGIYFAFNENNSSLEKMADVLAKEHTEQVLKFMRFNGLPNLLLELLRVHKGMLAKYLERELSNELLREALNPEKSLGQFFRRGESTAAIPECLQNIANKQPAAARSAHGLFSVKEEAVVMAPKQAGPVALMHGPGSIN